MLKNIAISLLACATVSFAGVEPGYSHDSNPSAYHQSWMTVLPDSLKLSYMSIPGTHDSMAHIGGDSVQTQSLSLNNQLYAGIRVLDIRILFQFNQFDLSHGVMPQPGNFDSVMQTVSEFLYNFPRETVLMRVKEEMHGLGNTESFEDAFKIYWSRYSHVFWQNQSKEADPSLGEIRGKVVVLQDFNATGSYGLSYGSFHAQDNYTLTTNWDLYTKWTEVKNQLELANAVGNYCTPLYCFSTNPANANLQFINYLSGATGVFPYFVASGKSSPATDAPRLATGKTTPGFSGWPDFPRTACFLGICTISFEGTNNLTYNWLAAGRRMRVGIIMADFPGDGLIREVIAVNQQALNGFQ